MNNNFHQTEDKIKKAIYNFLKKEGEKRSEQEVYSLLSGPIIERHPHLGSIIIYKGKLGDFKVNSEHGYVLSYSMPDRLSLEEAKKLASDFISRHVEDFKFRNFEQEYAGLDEPYWKEEWLEKPRKPEEVSIFPNYISISVNLDAGSVSYFSASDLRLVRTKPVPINEERACAIVRNKYPDFNIIETDLVEHTYDNGKNVITIWTIGLEPKESEDTAFEMEEDETGEPDIIVKESPLLTECAVNADTGELLDDF